ncbi:IclR family transcriptional regulator [Reyranella sp. CPCC 100927]|uniref:IclR family transcriptional regulator n=1 Tax=Reyranella sp. CPCC 100927 TaxID=2599616 RepID=UPI0011B7FF45|nr:IclR family transcriptional regulator [Reyranella sp. CPCC 100927]TWT00257.1 IclR family transcriptional regulator [Reyranella sp. CPCC 100927]
MARSATQTAGALRMPDMTPRAPSRVMAVIEALAREPDGLSLAALSRKLDLPKTSLFSLLRALESDSYVVNAHGLYRLGMASIRLGSTISGGVPQFRKIGALLPALATRTGETVMLAVPTEDGKEAFYVDLVEGPQAVRYVSTAGARRPLYCTAAGRVMLAFCDPAFTRTYLANTRLTAFTPQTTTDKDTLRKLIEDARRRGVAESRDQVSVGVWGFGAPVFDADRILVAAVMIAAPTDRAKQSHQHLAACVLSAGEEMSRMLGLVGPYIETR